MGIGIGTGSGGAREGAGRPPGVAGINRRSRQLLIDAEANGLLTPVNFLLGLMRDTTLPLEQRVQCAAIVCPYVHPRLVVKKVAYLDPESMSDAELLQSIGDLERKIAAMDADQALPVNDAPGAVLRRPSDDRFQPSPAPLDPGVPSDPPIWNDGAQPAPPPVIQQPSDHHQPAPPPEPTVTQRFRYDLDARRLLPVPQ